MVRVEFLAAAAAGLLPLATALPRQAPFTPPGGPVPLGVSWQETVSVPAIESWALNPTGDAAVIKVSTLDVETASTSYDLHLLAVNAQFAVPAVRHGPAHPEAIYAFLSDDTFAALSPSPSDADGRTWDLAVLQLNYTTLPPAFPPSAGEARVVRTLELGGRPREVVFAAEAGVLAIVMGGGAEKGLAARGPLVLVDLRTENASWVAGETVRTPLEGSDLIIEDIAASDSELAFVAYNGSIRPWNSTRSILYTVELAGSARPKQISGGKQGGVSSPAFGTGGRLAWLEQREDGNARGQRKLWMRDGGASWEVALDFELSPVNVLFSRNGEALYLLTLHDQAQSLFHLWVPARPSSGGTPPAITPTRIPSNGTVHSTPVHVGITPLDHAHLVGEMSSLTSARELWVISHSPHADPTYNYENIRLTYFTDGVLGGKRLSEGERVSVVNGVGDVLRGRVFVPEVQAGERVPMVFYLHGDEEGGGWHDWWMQYWNPNAMLAEGYAVVTINPTGAEGYSDRFTQARRHQWGNQTMADLSLALRHVLAAYPAIDGARTFAMGYGAFGGFAAHWIQGHAEAFGHTFRGMLSHDGILSPRWWAAETSERSKAAWEFGEWSYDEASPFTKWDPERTVGGWQTPELVITDGGDDGDVGPRSQSYATYALLQSRGIASRLVETAGWAPVAWHCALFDFFASVSE